MVSTWRLAGQPGFCELHWCCLVLTSPHRYSNGLWCTPEEGKKGFYIYRFARAALKSQPVRKNQKSNRGKGNPWPHKLSALISLLVSGIFSCSGQSRCEIISFLPFSIICLFYSYGEEGASTCLPRVLLQRKQVNGPAHQQWGLVWFISETHLLNVPFGKRLSAFNFPWSCLRINRRHELLWRQSKVYLALESAGEGERVAETGSIFLTFPMDPTIISRLHSQLWKRVRPALNPTSTPSLSKSLNLRHREKHKGLGKHDPVPCRRLVRNMLN